MTDHFLGKLRIFGKFVDERFLAHRRRSTSVAGLAGCLVAGGICEYRLIFQHFMSWDLFAVLGTMAVVKIAMMLWYRFKD